MIFVVKKLRVEYGRQKHNVHKNMPWAVTKPYIKCKAIKLDTYVLWELGVLWENRQSGVNQQKILKKKKKKLKTDKLEQEGIFLKVQSLPECGDCPSQACLRGGNSFLLLPVRSLREKVCELSPHPAFRRPGVLPSSLWKSHFELASDCKFSNQGQMGLGWPLRGVQLLEESGNDTEHICWH